jgi:CheY-like chemotaxis protein
MTTRSRILIADDHTLVAELCKRLLETEFDVIGTVSDGLTYIRLQKEVLSWGRTDQTRLLLISEVCDRGTQHLGAQP